MGDRRRDDYARDRDDRRDRERGRPSRRDHDHYGASDYDRYLAREHERSTPRPPEYARHSDRVRDHDGRRDVRRDDHRSSNARAYDSYYEDAPREKPRVQREYLSGKESYHNRQPGRQAGMTIDPKNRLGLAAGSAGREWSHGLFSCCDEGPVPCLYAWCCSCFHYAGTTSRLEHVKTHGQVIPQPEGTGQNCLIYFALMACTGIGGAILSCFERQAIRARYDIKGDQLVDGASVCCCFPCALVQQSREIEEEETALTRGAGRA